MLYCTCCPNPVYIYILYRNIQYTYCTVLYCLNFIYTVRYCVNIIVLYLRHLLCHHRDLCISRYCRSRERFAALIQENQVPLQLILNYDQTWCNAFREPVSTLRPKRSGGRRSKNHSRITKICGGRAGLSVCTSSWACGDRGPLFLSFSNRSVPDSFIAKMNEMLGFPVCFTTCASFMYARIVQYCTVFLLMVVGCLSDSRRK